MRYLIIVVMRDPRDEKYDAFMAQLREWEAALLIPTIWGVRRERTSPEELGDLLRPLICPNDSLLVTELERYAWGNIPELDSF